MNAFVDAHRAVYGVELICKVLPIAPSTYYLHAARQTDPGRRSARALLDERLREQIQRVWNDHCWGYVPARSGANCSAKASTWPAVRWSGGCDWRVCGASCAVSRSKPRSATRPCRARWIACIGNSRPIARMRCGYPISRRSLLGKASSMSPS